MPDFSDLGGTRVSASPILGSKFDSGHAIIPVLHPSGEIHNIAVPANVDLPELHQALVASDYHFPEKQPAGDGPNGPLETSPDFKEAARKAWLNVNYGDLPQESGFVVNKDGKAGPIITGKEIQPGDTRGSTTFHVMPDDFATLHTHPRPTPGKNWIQEPSGPDADLARNSDQNVYVVSSTGLWEREARTGNLVHVYSNNDWMDKKKKK